MTRVQTTLPTDSEERKNIPLRAGCYNYFPAALMGVAMWSKRSNDKHNPGEPLHHSRGKSMDHEECIERHSQDIADLEAAYLRESLVSNGENIVKQLLDEYDARAWRALAASQEFREKHGLAPLAPGARLPADTAFQNAVLEHYKTVRDEPAFSGGLAAAKPYQPPQLHPADAKERAKVDAMARRVQRTEANFGNHPRDRDAPLEVGDDVINRYI